MSFRLGRRRVLDLAASDDGLLEFLAVRIDEGHRHAGGTGPGDRGRLERAGWPGGVRPHAANLEAAEEHAVGPRPPQEGSRIAHLEQTGKAGAVRGHRPGPAL